MNNALNGGIVCVSRVKPIFYCDAKTLALCPRVGLDPQILGWVYQHVGI